MKDLKILVVDDEEDLCEILQYNLEQEGFKADIAFSSEQALQLDLSKYDFFLLDIMMGEISGLELAKIIRRNPDLEDKPILFITAKGSETDKLLGFKAGADDYVAKPFSVKEVIARIHVICKRVFSESKKESGFEYENLRLIPESKQVTINNIDVGLTKTEFEILHLLLNHAGRIYSRDEIMNKIWEGDTFVGDRTVDVNVRRIRKKIGEYHNLIKTKSGYGYYFDPRLK
ncbi:response regulator transcription factor [Marinifilum flexuosum]|uniref:Two-component system phosphate regulon response regulator PhoB n=1 Tax=Marinifilum flexuosum TaxID=1117708 RepID=A0A419XAZ5_9BACT|nr:response regulator transcription factor [Marinifilum flexuosum]RKE04928.1 two-component system phosphate regulon response regulator PhoB [Marinifilum flexuosum]